MTQASQSSATQPPSAKELSKTVVFATSGLGGMLGWAMVHPANTLAVRMNLAAAAGRKFSFSGMIAESGWMGLYDGLSAGVMRQVFYASSRFGLFETFRDKLHEIRGKTDFTSRVVVGALTGGIAAYISCPMEVAVVRMSNDSTLPKEDRRNYKNVVDTTVRIAKEEGIAAFWQGSNPFVARAMLVGVFQVATLDQFKDLYADMLKQQKNSISNVFCAAMSSGLIYSLATMPLEACKNRMASQKPDPRTGELPYKTIVQTLTKIAGKEGFMSLYNGFLPYYVRCGGHTVAMFIIVQMLRDAYTASM
ncbi:solute carrier family 25 (mitochondrial oxoglutarate transporter), member 11 [Fistulifera solaris]|uniref:Solute carrier family 25 (Mitochondrial oxoglutarate transporter), member 11 n=1 Tax=Fistulifera solaris TaxID=1519565 RepID=A0A1Z5J6H6_FISSO|nr:solute carrier family 25 (mitochondrial oxoglutarate transporter), member 11 [Fistulifera solaris]|eukprot:GAX09605.1 solute carrier family 25 (mitochondrial oxoglutarate transporter), member 11 [Fistulifera solaris]